MNARNVRLTTHLLLPGTLLLLGLIALPGCDPRHNPFVRRNQAELQSLLDRVESSHLASLPSANATSPQPTENLLQWREVAAELTDSIKKHESKPKIADPQRIRLAMLFMQHGEFNSAKAALEPIKTTDHLTARDRAFVALRDSTLWWWEECNRLGAAPSADFNDQGTRAIDQIVSTLEQLPNDSANDSIRQYYAEMAVRIANYLVPFTHGSESHWRQIEPQVLAAYGLFAETAGIERIQAAAAEASSDPQAVKVQMLAGEIQEVFPDHRERIARLKLPPQHEAFQQLILHR